MKKYLLLFITIFSIFFITDKVNALTYTKDNETITVNDNNIIYYLYKTYPSYFNNFEYFHLVKRTSDNLYWIYFMHYVPTQNSNGTYNIHYTSSSISFRYRSSNYTSFSESDSAGAANSNTYNDSYLPLFSNWNILKADKSTTFTANINHQQLYDYFNTVREYTITYYLNNEIYNTFIVNEGSSHILISSPTYDSATQNFTGWQYDTNIDLTNITQDITITGTLTDKPIYTITYFLDNKEYKKESIIEGTNYEIIGSPEFNKYTYSFSGWQYDTNIDLTNITQDITITGTLTELPKTPVYIDFPITKEDFYTLLVLVGTLNMILFLKWCFPFKGGRDLK